MPDIRHLSAEHRTAELYFHIDPCFVNLRKCGSTFGPSFTEFYKQRAHPVDAWPMNVFNDHLTVDFGMEWCRERIIPTLAESISEPEAGQVFCSVDRIVGSNSVYDDERVVFPIRFPFECELTVQVEFSTKHVVCDTGRVLLSRPSNLAIIGEIHSVQDNNVTIHPLVMGTPTFDHPQNSDKQIVGRVMWYALDLWETLPEDIDEFATLTSVPDPQPEEWMAVMARLSESDVKAHLCDILKDLPQKDWGGEQDDHFSSSVHIRGKRTTTAFLLKGPASFRG